MERCEGVDKGGKERKSLLYVLWQPGLSKESQNEWVNDDGGRRGGGPGRGGKVQEEEKKEGGFMIHLPAPDSRSILAEPRQSAHISLHLSRSPSCLLSILISQPHSLFSFYLLFLPCAGAPDLPRMVSSEQTDMQRSFILNRLLETVTDVNIAAAPCCWH